MKFKELDICRNCCEERACHDPKTRVCPKGDTRFRLYTIADEILDELKRHEQSIAVERASWPGLTISELSSHTGMNRAYAHAVMLKLVKQCKVHLCCVRTDNQAHVYRYGPEDSCNRPKYHSKRAMVQAV